jgi:hypothetical protein
VDWVSALFLPSLHGQISYAIAVTAIWTAGPGNGRQGKVETAPTQRKVAGPPRADGRLHAVGWVDQVVRREAFEAAHPCVRIQPHVVGRPWTAVTRMPGGAEVTVTDSMELGRLLDKLEALFAADDRLAQPEGDG